MSDVIPFNDALDAASAIHKNRHLLLGNGFSIACRDTFTYGRLLDEANLSKLSVDGPALFEAEGTTDFEEMISSLRVAGRMAMFYESTDADLGARLAGDADLVKAALAETLARSHPDNVGEIGLEEYEEARQFLASFGHIFTVSYDLLLYWTLMQEIEPKIRADDGFRADHDDPDAEWVRWDSYHGGSRTQNIYYLHGGLHLFEEGPVLKKLTFSRTGVAVVDQIREALDQEAYPLVITEGRSAEKLARIRHNDYLAKGLRSLAECQGSLFTHGHSLADNDAHVFRAIGGEGKFKALFVSLHGDPDSEGNELIAGRAAAISAQRLTSSPSRFTSTTPTRRRSGVERMARNRDVNPAQLPHAHC